MEEYTLTLTSEQARATLKAIELLKKLKVGLYGQIPYALIGEPGENFCRKRDAALPHLNRAFGAMSGMNPYKWSKDSEWKVLDEVDQALFYAIMKAEEPKAQGIKDMKPDEGTPVITFKEGGKPIETAGHET